MKISSFKITVLLALGMVKPSITHAQCNYILHKEDPIVINTDTTITHIDEAISGIIVDEDWYKRQQNEIRCGIGYSYQYFNEPVSSGFDYMYGFQFSLDGYYRRLYLGLNILYQSNILKTDSFYYDKYKDYNWAKDKIAKTLPITMRTGFCFIQKNRFRMTTYAGIGNARITQETGYDPNHDNELNTSILKGTRAELGLSADVLLYKLGYTISWIELSTNIGVARTEYEYLGTTYSLNAGMTLHITFRP